jgi:hypothetical protein
MQESFDLSIKDLHQIAGGLNIEGGHPGIDLHSSKIYSNHNSIRNLESMRLESHAITALWVNSVLVLDRPLIDHLSFDDLNRNNIYPSLENAIIEINEHQLLASYLMIIGYYQANGHEILNLPDTTPLKITIHLHQDTRSKPFLDIIANLVCGFLREQNLSQKSIEYRLDHPHYQSPVTSHNYQDTHILISLSQCAGFDPNVPAGSLILPNEFIPYNIVNQTIHHDKKYRVDNNLQENLPKILDSKYNDLAVKYVNQNYQSANLAKNLIHKASLMNLNDFKYAKILQVDSLWNPSNDDERVRVIM